MRPATMPRIEPIYTAANCHIAYQLNWTLTLFWRQAPPYASWFDALAQAVEPDGVRPLRHRFLQPDISQFFLSTKPHVAPVEFVRLLKGRLQRLLAATFPKAFQRNYAFRSVGAAKREVVQEYVASQVQHHPMADPRVNERLAKLQIHCPDVDLSSPRRTAHGQYWHNLHLVLVNDSRWREVRENALQTLHDTIPAIARKRGFLLSRAAILADHIHLTLGCPPDVSPMDAALCHLDNLAYANGMKALFEFGAYVGTFGEYDRGAVRAEEGEEEKGGPERSEPS